MEKISKEYKILFNGISMAIDQLQGLSMRLVMLQQQAEQEYIQRGERETDRKKAG